jgi:2,4-dienoyl-CoA reductase (NADPH2)
MVQTPEFVPMRCRVNAALGYDKDYVIQPALKKKKVMVVGGGPGGMEAARVAAVRGHEVILFEKENRLGGLLPWVAMIKGLDVDYDVMILADYLKNQITKLGVDIRLGEEFNPSVIRDINPDAVILAPGGIPTLPDIPGIDRSSVMSLDDLYNRMKDDLEVMEPGIMRGMTHYWDSVGKRVLIIGGTIEGSGLAEFLVERCRDVTITDENTIWGDGMMVSFSLRKVTRLPGVKYEEITDKGLSITSGEGKRQTIEADTIIAATSPGLNTELYEAIKGKVPEVYLLGMDDNEPGSIMNAVGNGYWVARGI